MGSTREPTFLGKPSPSLRRMQRMDKDALLAHLERLRQQAEARDRRLARLGSGYGQGPSVRRERVAEERDRLHALIEQGQRMVRGSRRG